MNFDLSALDGTNGFVIEGLDGADQLGRSVSNAGDVNGDGIDDVVIGAPGGDPGDPVARSAGESYVVFGSLDGFSTTFDLADLDGTNGFVLNGIDFYDSSGLSVSGTGDVNGDGIGDLLVGALDADRAIRSEGETYVVFGSGGGFGGSLDLADLDGSNGFVLAGIDELDRSAISVSKAGDVNGDGLDDIIIGAYRGDPGNPSRDSAGESYVVFGSSDSFAARIALSSLDGTNGFVLNGVDAGDQSGRSVSDAGDVNGDGIDDIIIGAFYADPSQERAGESYVVFGNQNGFGASFELSSLDGTNGFVLTGIAQFDGSGVSVSSAGDVNGDGVDDIIIGADTAGSGAYGGGAAYVVFGSLDGFATSLDLGALDGSNGFALIGNIEDGRAGGSVSAAGDVNGDGIDDIIIGAPAYYLPFAGGGPGEAYVIFGSNTGFAASMNLSDLDGTNGFIVPGIDEAGETGQSVSAAGDLNGDGVDDLIIGAPGFGLTGDPIDPLPARPGAAYVIFGTAPVDPLLVTTLGDVVADDGEISLREAVAAANELQGAQTITFAEAVSGTLRLTQGEIEITDALTIEGAGRVTITGDANGDDITEAGTDITDVAASLDGQDLLGDNSRIFNITEAIADTTFSGVSLTGGVGRYDGYGSSGGGAIASAADLVIETSHIAGNLAAAGGYDVRGGGIYGAGAVTATNTMLSGNVVESAFDGRGGAIAAGGPVMLSGSQVNANSVDARYSGSGGAVWTSGTLSVQNSTLNQNAVNSRSSSGGALEADDTIEITETSFYGNSASGNGASGGAVSAAVRLQTRLIIVSGSTFKDNLAEALGGYGGGGGAIAGGEVHISDTLFEENRTIGSFAAGGAVSSSDALQVSSSAFVMNSTNGYRSSGGAISSFGSDTFVNSTFSANATTGPYSLGGAISGRGDLLFYNSTVTGNSTSAGLSEGGGISVQAGISGSLTISNSIVTGNRANSSVAPSVNDIYTSGISPVLLGTNIIGTDIFNGNTDVGDTSAEQVFAQTFDNNGVAAGVLGADGTVALLAGGDAVDAGSAADLPADTFDLDGDGDTTEPLPLDAIGNARIIGAAPDLGAVESLVLLGTPDPDDLVGGASGETILALTSNDTVDAGGGNDLVDLGLGDDSADGGAGIDTLSFASLAAPGFVFGDIEIGVIVDLSNQGTLQATGQGNDIFTSFENLEGSDFADFLTGDGAANAINGGAGGDVLVGGDGDDTLEGGEGFDAVEGGLGADLLFGGTGGNAIEGDLATYFSATGPLVFDFGADVTEILAGSSAEVLEDTIGDDIEGVAGASDHSNTFLASQLTGLSFFLGGSQSDTFVGGSGTDQLIGLAGNDVMYGNDGGDALIGEGGDDDLFGGAGQDFFFFDAVNEGDDTIHDLELGVDFIFFTGGNLVDGDLTFADTVAGGTAATDTLITYEVGGVAGSITIIDHDADATEAGAIIVFG